MLTRILADTLNRAGSGSNVEKRLTSAYEPQIVLKL